MEGQPLRGRMFQKREARFVPAARPADLWPRAWDWWSRQGFSLAQSGPYQMRATSFYSSIGLRRECLLLMSEASGGTNVDLSLDAQITDEGLVIGAVSAVVFWPVALAGGAVSYSEYETDARNLMNAFWQFITAPAAHPGAAPAPPMPSPCPGCGAAMLPDWNVCPYCGRRRSPG